MSEGTARELVARAIEGVLLSGGAPRCRELAEMAAKHVVEDLTEAGALAPAGLTGDERWAVDFAADCLAGIVAGEQFDAYIRKRAAHHAGALRSLWKRSGSSAADAATGETS